MARHILFYKPYGVLSQFTDPDKTGHPTLGKYIDLDDVYPCGRLDHDSEGLLLLTGDGRLQRQLTDPRFGHPRTYWVQVEGIPTEAALDRLRRGIEIQRRMTRPCEAKLLDPAPNVPPRDPPIRVRRAIPDSWIELTLTEGRNRQVRRMTAAAGHPTLRLIRVAIAGLGIGELQPGQWRWVTAIPDRSNPRSATGNTTANRRAGGNADR